MSEPHEITRLLRSWREGSEESGELLWKAVYDELRQLAGSLLHLRAAGRRHQATSLVHRAYLRLLGSEVEWTDRSHFFAVAARAMRFVLADEARRQLAAKRGEGGPLELDGFLAEPAGPGWRPEEVIAVHQALERLAQLRPRHERLVELRYFAGLTIEETAEVLGVNPRTVRRDWRAVRTWLHGELRPEPVP